MTKVMWDHPLTVDFTQSGERAVAGPAEALNCLAHYWPDHRGPRYVAARSICRAAIDGRKSVNEARKVFETAVKEAGLKLH